MLKQIFTGAKRKTIFIAEIGLNHNGDPETAERMIQAAAEAGADAVKFQTFVPELLNSVYADSLLKKGVEENPDSSTIDFFAKLTLAETDYKKLKLSAEKTGLVFFSSVFDLPSLEMLERIGVPLYKLASSEVTNHTLIKAVAATGRPVILSTGMASETEIGEAVEIFRAGSSAEMVLMHCVSLYPLPPEAANIRRISSLKERFNLETGFSDHSSDSFTSVLAAAAGALIFEKHFTLSEDFECPDKAVSFPPGKFSSMIDMVENAVLIMGSGGIDECSRAEMGVARAAKRSLFAARDIKKGDLIKADDLIALRPGTGIPDSRRPVVAGRKAACDINKGFLIREEHLEN
jgi:N-acetylneuraminate synthase/N,N'-diacetyllegionaminate synthase